MEGQLDDDVDARRVVAQRRERFALAVQPLAGARVRFRVERDAPERRNDVDGVNGGLHDLDAIHRVKARPHVVDTAQAELDGFGEAGGVERLLERAGGSAAAEECREDEARAPHDFMVAHGAGGAGRRQFSGYCGALGLAA